MNSKKFLLVIVLFAVSLLGACSKEDETTPPADSGTGNLVEIIEDQATHASIASAPLGMLFLYSWHQLPPETTIILRGIIAQMKLLGGETTIDTEETFLLLQELGSVLQVDVMEILNQSEDRSNTLNIYTTTLQNTTAHGVQMLSELIAEKEGLEETRKTQREEVRDKERAIKEALDAKDFTLAGSLQPEQLAAQQKLSETETDLEQTKDIIKIYEELLEIAHNRDQAILENREILVAGLKVVEVPGIEDIGVLEDAKSLRERLQPL